jgi:hypothetical protein
MCRLVDLLVQQEQRVHYPPNDVRVYKASEVKTEKQLRARLAAGTFVFDCSQTAEIIAVCAGLKWPAKMRNGFTGTMLDGLSHYSNPKGANRGAFVVFGPYPGHHVCVVYKPGANPLLYSHGSERSSHLISLSQEAQFQPPPVTFLSIAKL